MNGASGGGANAGATSSAPVGQAGAELAALFEAKVLAELAAADAVVPDASLVHWRGRPTGRLAVIEGEPSANDLASAEAVSGPAGEALLKALEALRFDTHDVFYTCSRPGADTPSECVSRRLRLQIEAVDPHVLLALDGVAAADLAVVSDMASLPFGKPVVDACGRSLVAVDGLVDSLHDPARKRRVWSQLKAMADLRGIRP